ncbi:MAG: L,D-transpeptidase family protein [Clostridia bacterium]|nr:L,D-transpeptidase family protein [Clostridia bacterium]
MFKLARSGHIEIDLLKRQLLFYQGLYLAGTYPVAIGKPSTPSPVGEWSIINKKILNYESVFGSRWMGLSNPGYGIHGTNNPSSIGKAVSNGCIRMYNHHVEELFNKVSIGTRVFIHNGNGPGTYEPSNPQPQNPPSDPVYQPSERTYQVKPGDTLWSIAKKLNIPLNELIKANPYLNPKNLMVGQVINLP